MQKIDSALSNKIFINGNTIIKKYSKDKFKKNFKNQEKIILEKLDFNFTFKKNTIKMEYLKHEKFDDKNISIQDITNVVNELNNFHKLDQDELKITPFEKVYKNFLLKRKDLKKGWIDKFEKENSEKALKLLTKENIVVLHNDMVEGNLLKIKGKIKFIDFEYSGLGNQIFDIASFLTERKLTNEQKKFFLTCFNKKENDFEIKIVSAFLQIFWARWAAYKYKETKNKIYKEILDWKLEEYKKIKKFLDIKN